VASAFLARVYLYIGDWDKAEAESNIVISNTALFELAANLDDVFLKNSREAIWQWMPSNSGQNAVEGSYFILTGAPNIASLSLDLVSHFETGDKRKERWMGSFSDGVNTWYFPFKYKQKVPTSASVEYSVVMRLAELYLVRSEARANMNNLTGAVDDLDKLRSRAELPLISDTSPGINKEELLLLIGRERRSELFTENHRWYDLIRTGQADVVMTAIKAGWQATDILFPLPESELLINPLLQPQNPGY
ncbi:MAG TPA: RagB/SusD family nutrient uptake outer membrane protein, partial [Sphingobacterium sp.]|nr:RagB/SusD family nutrient uptake outer membrane protein [Sphingobacterium sp.]